VPVAVVATSLTLNHPLLEPTYTVDPLKKDQQMVNFHFILNTSNYLEDEHFIQKYFDHES